MARVMLAAALTLAIAHSAQAAAPTAVPHFADYPAGAVFKGHPARVDLASDPDAPRFRTRLEQGARRGPNFAGHDTLVAWGCGTDCHVFAVIDARTGAVTFPGGFEVGIAFRRDSRLVVINPPEVVARRWKLPGDCGDSRVPRTTYLEWTGRAFRLIRVVDPCAAASKAR